MTSESVVDRLERHLERVEQQWHDAVEEGDEKGAAYALGKKSAFTTAIEEAKDRSVGTDTDRSGGDGQ